VSCDPVKSMFLSIVKSRRLGNVPLDTDLEAAPKVQVFSATLVTYRAFIFSKTLA